MLPYVWSLKTWSGILGMGTRLPTVAWIWEIVGSSLQTVFFLLIHALIWTQVQQEERRLNPDTCLDSWLSICYSKSFLVESEQDWGGRENPSLLSILSLKATYGFFFGLFWISSLNRNKIKLEATHMTDRRIISLICKELLQIKKEKNQLNSIKWMKDTKR